MFAWWKIAKFETLTAQKFVNSGTVYYDKKTLHIKRIINESNNIYQ